MLDDDTCNGRCQPCADCTSDAPTREQMEKLEADVRHLRAGIKAYRSVLTISGDRHPYSVIENKNLLYIRAWEQIDQARNNVPR